MMLEKMTLAHSKADAAHNRLDKMEVFISGELKEIKSDIKEAIGHMNRSKGWAAASILLAGILGGALAAAISSVLKH